MLGLHGLCTYPGTVHFQAESFPQVNLFGTRQENQSRVDLPGDILVIWLLAIKTKVNAVLNQSNDDSFVKRVAKNNGDRHKIHEIFLIICFVFVIILL